MIVCCLLRTLIWILVLLTERFLIRIVSTSLALLEGKYVTSAYDNMAPLFAIEKDTRQHMHVQVKRRLWLWAYSFTPATLWTPSWFRCWAVSTRFIFCGKKKKKTILKLLLFTAKRTSSLCRIRTIIQTTGGRAARRSQWNRRQNLKDSLNEWLMNSAKMRVVWSHKSRLFHLMWLIVMVKITIEKIILIIIIIIIIYRRSIESRL